MSSSPLTAGLWLPFPATCIYMYMIPCYMMYNIHMYMKPCSQLCYVQCTSLISVFRDVGEAVVGLT